MVIENVADKALSGEEVYTTCMCKKLSCLSVAIWHNISAVVWNLGGNDIVVIKNTPEDNGI